MKITASALLFAFASLAAAQVPSSSASGSSSEMAAPTTFTTSTASGPASSTPVVTSSAASSSSALMDTSSAEASTVTTSAASSATAEAAVDFSNVDAEALVSGLQGWVDENASAAEATSAPGTAHIDSADSFFGCFSCFGTVAKALPCVGNLISTGDVGALGKCGLTVGDLCGCVDCIPVPGIGEFCNAIAAVIG